MTETLFPAYVFLDLTNADEVFYELKRIPDFQSFWEIIWENLFLWKRKNGNFWSCSAANESPVNNADKGAGYYLIRNTKVYLDAQGEIERLDGPLEYFKEKIIRLNLRKRYALIETAIRGEQQTAMLGIKLEKD